ncbi:MAG: TatD family hydrolase [candidate division WOR-3 bacterium]|nr:TatD family hydrolase [candidate division WOR-3 bacterium]
MIDTHCHLIDPQFNHDLQKVLERAKKARVKCIINIGYDLDTSRDTIRMSDEYDFLLPVVGIHPNELAEESLHQMDAIEELCNDRRVIGIGETGLDYYRNYSTRAAQQNLFRAHINLARKYNLPLIIHTRNSIDDAIGILKEEKYHKGVFHCYSGTYEQAKEVMDMGFYLGFGGVLTFSRNAREVFTRVSLDFVLFETDAPFLAPASHRGQRNEPSYLPEILNFAASVKGLPVERIEEVTDRNAQILFTLRI